MRSSQNCSKDSANSSMIASLLLSVPAISRIQSRMPHCNGDGIDQPYFPDTRKLPAASRLAYSGVKVGKNAVEITAISREWMFDAVMKRLGLADSKFAQRMQQIEIERRQRVVEKLCKFKFLRCRVRFR